MKTHLIALAASLLAIRLTAAPADFVAHEWGTFTSVQGADGVQMDWNPLNVSELPKFVYDRNRRPGRAPGAPVLLAKSAFTWRQRMETPVIYFYSAKPRTVDVAVNFPGGMITEWFPRETPAAKGAKGGPALHWANLQIVPRVDAKSSELPLEKSGSHYYAARGAESDFVRMTDGDARESEKFLFYRGVGNFEAPLKVTVPSSGTSELHIENTGAAPLMDLFVCDVRQRALREGMESIVSFQHIEKLDAGAAQNAKLNAAEPVETQHDQLTAQLRTALERAGLFPAEAAAMVKTWEDSWLRESGVRVLYVLPRVWTDGVLPLAITPAPRDTVRVMVGRAEVITPAMDAAVAEEALRFRSTDEAERNTAIANLRALGLGRFLESAMRRLAMQHRDDRELSTAGWTMLQLASQPPAPTVSAR